MTQQQYSSLKRRLILMQCSIESAQNVMRQSLDQLSGLYDDVTNFWNKVVGETGVTPDEEPPESK